MKSHSVMVSISFLRGSGKRKQGGRPGLSIKVDSQLRNSAGLEPASPLLSSPSGMEDTLHATYSIVGVVYIMWRLVVKQITVKNLTKCDQFLIPICNIYYHSYETEIKRTTKVLKIEN
jgi:hypothetical protein